MNALQQAGEAMIQAQMGQEIMARAMMAALSRRFAGLGSWVSRVFAKSPPTDYPYYN